jgi:hypothetical protein
MKKNNIEEIIKRIKGEYVEYAGIINFASKGINCDTDGLLKAFKYGVEVGVECTKKDVIRIIKEEKEKDNAIL